ncbi:unnamed protein product [Citrullus colocynthis]|uniref:Uncharacterized protein n=1 Tax=Citrullus colocynthis TaxID=252529 RepID=A0ABP0YWY7_9ROSI
MIHLESAPLLSLAGSHGSPFYIKLWCCFQSVLKTIFCFFFPFDFDRRSISINNGSNRRYKSPSKRSPIPQDLLPITQRN